MSVASPPAGPVGPAEMAPATRDLRWNVTFLGGDVVAFFLALAFASPQTLIPAFAERLGAPNLVIGAIPALMTVGWMLPAIFVANYAQGLPRKLPFLLRWSVLERIPYLVLGIAALTLAPSEPGLTLVLLLLMLGLMTVSGGFLIPAWLDMIGKLVPTTLRGRFFAVSTSLSAFIGLGGAALVTWLLDRYGYPTGYGLCFLVAFGWMLISYVALALVREPASDVTGRTLATGAYLRQLPEIVRTNQNLARFLGARALAVSGMMATGFYTVYALRRLGGSDADVGAFTVVMLLTQSLGTLAFGWIADHRGHLLVLTLGAAATGLGIASTQVSAMTIGLEFGPEAERPTYVAINNSAAAPFALAGPLIGGVLADAAGYVPVFVLAATLSLGGAAAFRFLVREPRSLKPAEQPAP